MPKVIRYTPELQSILKSKTEPAPYMHCVIDLARFRYSDGSSAIFLDYAIYIWDTREVLEAKHDESFWGKPMDNLKAYAKTGRVKDPMTPLKGDGPVVRSLNDKFKK
jgi:hypothetical protein